MPPSQLKRLKSSLRDQGVGGPPKSKKQKQAQFRNPDSRIQRHAALQGIRDSFNPFEIQSSARTKKFETTSLQKPKRHLRPGQSKSLGEEVRKRTLLPELQSRNKSGGVVDRRIGEDDPTMDPEDRALQRFTRERTRQKGAAIFDLEGDGDEALTHAGQSLDLSGNMLQDASADDSGDDTLLKRRRTLDNDQASDDNPEEPARKKSRQEVMDEVMAKSKAYKYERQKAKEDDDDLRDELDKGMPDMLTLLQGYGVTITAAAKTQQTTKPLPASSSMNPERMAMLNGLSRQDADKQYDARLRQMVLDKRAIPADRTKTDEEKAADAAQKLKELEDSRLRRMRGEQLSDDEPDHAQTADIDDLAGDAAQFGLNGHVQKEPAPILDEEDDFDLDENLVGSAMDSSEDESNDSDASQDDDNAQDDDDDQDSFVQDILSKDALDEMSVQPATNSNLPYAYDCPRTHADLLRITEQMPDMTALPTAVQRIRALYHPSLSADNKAKLSDFSAVLVDHIVYMAQHKHSLQLVETLIRHIHSLSRTFPESIANAFRRHLSTWLARGSIDTSDLIVLLAIGSIYPTSDHFHQVVTPAITLMARWLGLTVPTSTNAAFGAAIVALCLQYQRLSKRYIPESVRFTSRVLQVSDIADQDAVAHMDSLETMATLWHDKSSFIEIFAPINLTNFTDSARKSSTNTPNPTLISRAKKLSKTLHILRTQATHSRHPLALHNHKPIAIRSSYPKFEESFNPDRHYDPDRARTEASKLQKEYKREHKAAVRDLRKDANFIARTQLADKRARDEEYEKKYKRLVAEIQGTEGHEANSYEREKRARLSKR